MAGLFGRKKKKFSVEVQLVCPLCRETLGTEGEVDVEKDLAWCPFCKREMSFGDVADFSTVVSLEKQPLPEGLSLLPDAESLRTVVLTERNRFERGIILVLAVALLAFGGFLLYPVQFMLGGGIFLGFGVLLVGALIVEPDLELIIRFFPDHCECRRRTLFRRTKRILVYDADSTIGLGERVLWILSPHRQPQKIDFYKRPTDEQFWYLMTQFIDAKHGISAGTFVVREPNPDRKPPQELVVSWGSKLLGWLWCAVLIAIPLLRILRRILE